MRGVIGSVLVAVWLGFFTVAAAQLPPDVVADKYLVQAERLIAAERYGAALEVMDKIVALQREHDLALPEEFHFTYARAALSAGSIKTAMDSVNRYLSAAGREGEYYREALALLVKAEGRLLAPEMVEIPGGTFSDGLRIRYKLLPPREAGARGDDCIVRAVEVRGDIRGVRSFHRCDGPRADERLFWGSGPASRDQRLLGGCGSVCGVAVGAGGGELPVAERGRVGVCGAGGVGDGV